MTAEGRRQVLAIGAAGVAVAMFLTLVGDVSACDVPDGCGGRNTGLSESMQTAVEAGGLASLFLAFAGALVFPPGSRARAWSTRALAGLLLAFVLSVAVFAG